MLNDLKDRSFEKRKHAALTIQQHVQRESQFEDGEQRVERLIQTLATDFVNSVFANQKKGGLAALSATVVGIGPKASRYLGIMVPAVLGCFIFDDTRVRFHACEAMLNIARVCQDAVLPFFNEIFRGICKLVADGDTELQQGASVLERTFKEIVAQSDAFDPATFIPVLVEFTEAQNSFVQVLVVSWICALNDVADIEMLDFLPQFFAGLFTMLESANTDVRNVWFPSLHRLI